MPLEAELKAYDYILPKELIAQKPAHPREAAKLLIYNKHNRAIRQATFAKLADYLPKNSVLIFNQTRVIPARLCLKKPTGGKVEILYISHDKTRIKALANKKISIGDRLTVAGSTKTMAVAGKHEKYYYFEPSFSTRQIVAVLKKYGKMPLPPYIKNSPLSEARKKTEYQTVFAKNGLSVAAPTASLHFTKKLLSQIKKQGSDCKFITLNVGLGTFAPLTQNNIDTGRLHVENFEISSATAKFLNQAKTQGRPIIAVGTTVVRALESAAGEHNPLQPVIGSTDLFIRPGYDFKFIDGVITNFHVPKSSLMMLVAAMTGKTELLKLYLQAIEEKYRFFSFGDGMLILP